MVVVRRVHGPKVLLFLGVSPPSHDEALQEPAAWNRSDLPSEVPSPALRGPGGTEGPLAPYHSPPPPVAPRKRKRGQEHTSPDSTAVGGYGPTTEDSMQGVAGPSSPTKFVKRRNAANDVWTFVRGVGTEDGVSIEQWPDDYDEHLARRPDTPFVGCKFCTQFG